ncbi:hypothetical protein [Saccharothrix sp. ST-888]|uniref:hypothetical protein n=1 Tax=Saccharothrix sp. ST-888 TaxID=1427391 RepID=UPI0005ECC83E|nr:hypothetical protein [Saccharothrix sp. ST-888]KJK55654.1 hypothetical protein UK12_27455 [Saccharothrix sp. ST-888]
MNTVRQSAEQQPDATTGHGVHWDQATQTWHAYDTIACNWVQVDGRRASWRSFPEAWDAWRAAERRSAAATA